MPHAALALDTASSAPHAASEPAARLSPLDAVIETVAARREEFDRLSHVPRDVIALFKQAGIYRAGTPRRFGGDALAPTAFLDMIERIATADGSAAWVASFGSANVYLAALPLETQAELYASGPDQVFAGGLFPVQPAQPAPGGWRVNGTWKFASGCKGADWLGVGIAVPGAQAAAPNTPRPAVVRAD
ncbi:acyl-CoA dehydrogenase family protein, partial [Burkholderia sp. LMG 13014]|uniref:acyl-CoA dehydrogenase family protein n=1 Tax=Burkholderia sp. LMG 13014 TaxID=2709306 RepID=UPI0035A873A5